jgi:hypothetical protein
MMEATMKCHPELKCHSERSEESWDVGKCDELRTSPTQDSSPRILRGSE